MDSEKTIPQLPRDEQITCGLVKRDAVQHGVGSPRRFRRKLHQRLQERQIYPLRDYALLPVDDGEGVLQPHVRNQLPLRKRQIVQILDSSVVVPRIQNTFPANLSEGRWVSLLDSCLLYTSDAADEL